MRWKTWIIVIVAFIGINVLADVLLTRALFHLPLADASRIHRLYLDNSDDIPIFGTSKARGNYSPLDMGIPAFNYGMDGASFEATDVLLQIELAKQRTTPIIVELQYDDTQTLGFQDRFIPFATNPRFRQLLKRFNAMSWRYYFPGFRYFGYYDVVLQYYMNERMHVEKVDRAGFRELVRAQPFDRAQMDGFIRERLKTHTGYFQDEDQNRRLVAHITENPKRLFFLVISPYHKSYFAHFQNAEKLEAFKKQLAALPNAVVIDWGQLDYPDEDFLDTLHLRREAAAKFSQQLGEEIRKVLRERSLHTATVNTESK